MSAIIQSLENEFTAEERRLFESRAARAGRRPGVHLKHLLFGGEGCVRAVRPNRKVFNDPSSVFSPPGRPRKRKPSLRLTEN